LIHELPPLTILVVKQDIGMPGAGFIAAQDIPKTQIAVFSYDWVYRGCPSVQDFEDAVAIQPSNGVQP
jgi:hypothetical protein